MDQAPSIHESRNESGVDAPIAPPFEGNLVRWRLAHGSLCHLCPLNGQRKVGCDGPQNADHILVGEAPGKDEETYRSGVDEFGLPFVGKSGWAAKQFLFSKAGLVDLAETRGRRWGRIQRLNAFVLNVAMCRPPKNKITSPNGRKAVAACRNSAIAVIQKLFEIDPHRAIESLGGTALELLQPETKGKVGVHRGRPRKIRIDLLEVWEFDRIAKLCLRGKKPPLEWTGKPRKEWVFIDEDPIGNLAQIGWRNHIGWILNAIKKGERDKLKPPKLPKPPKEPKPKKPRAPRKKKGTSNEDPPTHDLPFNDPPRTDGES